MRYSLGTLLIALTIAPPAIALVWWYWKESTIAFTALLVFGLTLILGLLNLAVWALERICKAIWQSIAGANGRSA